MKIKFYNTLTKKKEDFEPINPEQIKMYVCGPTVYDRAHIGNARSAVVFDVLYRFLCQFYKVIYVRNITDIDDKIIKVAQQKNIAIEIITQQTTKYFHEDMQTLNVLPPTLEPKATENIDSMITMISNLIQLGHAYIAEGHVLFDVESYPNYGQLSNRNANDQTQESRINDASYKKNVADFILWKPSTKDMPGWNSPWGRGRPGWHIECSAMIEKHLGPNIDIHGGGQDLIFPHHENEIAQSQCSQAKGHLAKYWLHNGMLMLEGQKMSKSLNNIFTVNELLQKYNGEVIRFAILSSHYRQPLMWNNELLQQSQNALDSLYRPLLDLDAQSFNELAKPIKISPIYEKINTALSDDLNAPLAISGLHDLAKQIFQEKNIDKKRELQIILKNSAYILGILQQNPQQWFQDISLIKNIDTKIIEKLILKRELAKKDKKFTRADEIRNTLYAQGIILEDTPTKTIWRTI